MIDMKALEQSLNGILSIGRGESEFTINGVTIKIRVLKPHEEMDVQKNAYEVIKNSKENDTITTMEYLDRFRLNTLAEAIVEINGQDFREVSFIETGDVLPNGKKIQIPKAEALKKVLSSFNRTILVGMFKKYTELVEKTEIESEKYVEVDIEELDAEISRLENRIDELKRSKEQRLKKEQDVIAKHIKAAGEVSGVTLKEESVNPQETEEDEELDFEKEVELENQRLMAQRLGKPTEG